MAIWTKFPTAARLVSSQHFGCTTLNPSVLQLRNFSIPKFRPPSFPQEESPVLTPAEVERRMDWHPKHICGISLTLEDKVGQLLSVLKIFEKHNISLTRIHSQPQPLSCLRQVFTIHFRGETDAPEVRQLLQDVSNTVKCKVTEVCTPEVPWFPRSLEDIDQFSNCTLDAGTELTSDHAGFHDQVYRARRESIVANAADYSSGNAIPVVDYSESEVKCWSTAYHKLRELHAKHACDEYNSAIRELEEAGIYGDGRIPQLQEVSDYLMGKTGFRLRPVTGLLSGRDFLNALALRVFFSTQYIRHPSTPLYTPEPDVIHELIGHAPMLANKDFADFSQVIGLASLGATDDQVKMLATCYWFSVEFGVLFQDGCLRAFGAGLLSSFGELKYATSPTNSKVAIRAWDPYSAATQDYPITTYQPVYYAARSLVEAKELMLQYCQHLAKPFNIRFDPETHTIQTDMDVNFKPVSVKF